MSSPFIGEIRIFAGNFAPRGWALCNGALMDVSQNTALFSLLGVTYGGDGRTTFALPDLRGRAPNNQGQGPGLSNYREGQKGGTETVTLNSSELPGHNHHIMAANDVSAVEPSGRVLGQRFVYYNTDTSSLVSMSGDEIGNTGGGQSQPLRRMPTIRPGVRGSCWEASGTYTLGG